MSADRPTIDELMREVARPLASGDRVRSRWSAWTGTVVKVVNGATAGSRYVVVRWDVNGAEGRPSRASLVKIDLPEDAR